MKVPKRRHENNDNTWNKKTETKCYHSDLFESFIVFFTLFFFFLVLGKVSKKYNNRLVSNKLEKSDVLLTLKENNEEKMRECMS